MSDHIESRNIIPCPPPTSKNFRDLTGMRFGRLVAQSFYGKNFNGSGYNYYWTCVCDCGTVKNIHKSGLVAGTVFSCGCLQHGQSKTPTYKSWIHMRERCYSTSTKNFMDYGGRGIAVCERWRDSFENFYADMGDQPPGLSIERRDNNLGYSPENCCWATRTDQARNRRSTRLITYNGATMCVTAWEDRFGWKRNIIGNRLSHGWSIERAMTQQPGKKLYFGRSN